MTKEEVKERYSMADILERYGLPEPNRRGFIRCPFHDENTPSMKVYKKDFHCFGCGANGDVISFVERMEGVSFSEALKSLGGDTGSSFSARMEIYQARKRREKKLQIEAVLAEKREMNYRQMKLFRRALEMSEPLSEGWAMAYNELQYQEYLWDVLNDPDECYQAIGQGGA